MALSARTQNAVDLLHRDLRELFGDRLTALIVYGPHARREGASLSERATVGAPINTLALVTQITLADLSASAARAATWTRQGLATPLILTTHEFRRSLDVFPFEYGDIIAHHVAIAGTDPLQDLKIKVDDLRRACEVQAKSHLIHLREGYIEARGREAAIARLIAASAAPFAALLARIAQLQGTDALTTEQLVMYAEDKLELPRSVIARVLSLEEGGKLPNSEAAAVYAQYLAVAERLWRFVDGWRDATA